MRFFKYLVLILLSSISVKVFAERYEYTSNFQGKTFGPADSADAACKLIDFNTWDKPFKASSPSSDGSGKCLSNSGNTIGSYTRIYNKCPAAGWPVPVYLPSGTTQIPIRMCKDGCTLTGSGRSIETPNHTQTIMQYTGNSINCTTEYSNQPTKCDTSDPYGDCYVPPNSDCLRTSNGSIYCPEDSPPPLNETCNGATYCKRPPEGCGNGYVSGSFNGQQLCVKSGPSDPNEPDEPEQPNQCTASYCPKPDQGKDCPEGYYTSTYNGQKICVKDNPNPNQPNQNDPNNNDGGDDGGGASEPTGGDDGSTGSVNLKPVIDAINSLKAALLTAFETLSRKLSSLVDGQKTSNEHLKNIKDESIKSNEKLDKSNEHLDKIEEATQATSTAVGETNKKLDQIFSDQGKEQIEQLGEQSTDSRLTGAESEMTNKLQTFANTLSYSSSHACISDFTVTNIPHFGSMTVPLSKWCDLLALVKLLLKLAVLMLALKMIDATVRAF